MSGSAGGWRSDVDDGGGSHGDCAMVIVTSVNAIFIGLRTTVGRIYREIHAHPVKLFL